MFYFLFFVIYYCLLDLLLFDPFLYKQHFCKQHHTEIGKKSGKC